MLRGFVAALCALAGLGAAAVPSRLRAVPGSGEALLRTVAGALLDLAGALVVLAPLLFGLAALLPLVVPRARRGAWQVLGPALASVPLGFALWVLTVTAQEVKSERGAFPTVFDLAEGGTNAAFVLGTVGYLSYARVWMPGLVGLALLGLVLALARPRDAQALPWRPWGAGLALGLVTGSLALFASATAQGALSNRYGVAALGDPMTGLVESALDVVVARGPSTPRALVLGAELPATLVPVGAARLGWPPPSRREDGPGPCRPHPYARPLDVTNEPPTKDPRGRALLEALARASAALQPEAPAPLAVLLVSLEGFRGDDLHALNPAAPAVLAPFVTSLYDGSWAGGRALTARRAYQAGVRTAHGLGAMTCGLGTLPYNLAFIRDLQPFPVRCASDVLHEAGFSGSFFYGSDGRFDEMDRFLAAHGYGLLVSQAELPKGLPTGTWDAVSDFAVFDEAVRRVSDGLARGESQFSLVMSLSNHSPFTAPTDLPPEVRARVDTALATAPHRADADDRLRLVTYAYTDAAVARLLAGLEARGSDQHALVLLMADHSTGHAYVWGPPRDAPESDEMKAQVPFALVVPEAMLAQAKDRAGAEAALAEAQRLLDEAPLSQNDVPALTLALAAGHPQVKALPPAARWHTLGGQLTSPWFEPGGENGSYLLGINGVSELYALDREGARVGDYEDSVFLKTRADRYRVTPRLIPVTATLQDVLRRSVTCPAEG